MLALAPATPFFLSHSFFLADLYSSDWLNNANVIAILFPITQSHLNSHLRYMSTRSVCFPLLA